MSLLPDTARAWGWPLTTGQLAQFDQYRRLLQSWSAHTNLTAITETHAIDTRLFLDSLACATITGDLNDRRLIDVGTGAGFPGLPLKILFPRLRLTLVDSVGKKTAFLSALIAELQLADVVIWTERAEVLGQMPSQREQYDWAIGRAVAHLRTLVEYLLPLARVGGAILAPKGEQAAQEAAEAQVASRLLGGGAPTLHPVDLPGLPAPHYLVHIPKVAPTPAAYPRRVGLPVKRPL